jgi:hypothetical protein
MANTKITDSGNSWREWMDAIKQRGVNLTTWEEDFIESIDLQIEGGRVPSEKQAAIIERIYTDRVP